MAEQKVRIGYKEQWFKILYTNDKGRIELSFPWDSQYVIETVYTDQNPGTFQGDDYKAVRHTATFYIPLAQ